MKELEDRARLSLHRVGPNPASGEVEIGFRIQEAGRVRGELFDVRGRRVLSLFDREFAAGEHVSVIPLPSAELAAGSYFVTLTGAGLQRTARLVVVN